MDERLYRVEKAGELLGGLSRAQVYRLLASGELKATKIGRSTRIAREDLDEFVQEKRRETRSRVAVPA